MDKQACSQPHVITPYRKLADPGRNITKVWIGKKRQAKLLNSWLARHGEPTIQFAHRLFVMIPGSISAKRGPIPGFGEKIGSPVDSH